MTVHTLGRTEQVVGNYYRYDHLSGGLLYVLRPVQPTQLNHAQALAFAAEGHTFYASR